MSLVAACGGSSGGGNANSAHLTVWAMGAEGDNLKTLAADFTKQNPGIQVSVQSIAWSDAHSKFLAAIAGQQTPDLAEMGQSTHFIQISQHNGIRRMTGQHQNSGIGYIQSIRWMSKHCLKWYRRTALHNLHLIYQCQELSAYD